MCMAKLATDLMARMKNSRNKNMKKRNALLVRKQYGGEVELDPDTGELVRTKEPDFAKIKEATEHMKKRETMMEVIERQKNGEPEPKPEEKKVQPSQRSLRKKKEDELQIIDSKFLLFIPFTKVEKKKGKLIVSGIATKQEIDLDGDIMMIDAVKDAMPDYMEFNNIREMHTLSAVGKMTDHEFIEDEKSLYITTEIIDPIAIKKVEEEVYKGFSLGGQIIDAEMLEGVTPDGIPLRFRITEIKIIEISLVDRPASPSAMIDAVKASKLNFTPDHAFVFKSPKSLTTKRKGGKVGSNPQENKYAQVSFSTSLLTKLKAMSKTTTVEDVTNAALVELAKSHDLDLTKMEGSKELDAKDIAELIQFGVSQGMAYAKSEDATDEGEEEAEGEDNGASEAAEGGDESTDEGESSDEGEESDEGGEAAGDEDESSDDSEGEGEAEAKADEGGESTDEGEGEGEKPLKKKKKKVKKASKNSSDAKLVKAIGDLSGVVSKLDKKLSKAVQGESSQTAEELSKKKEEEAGSFSGVFM